MKALAQILPTMIQQTNWRNDVALKQLRRQRLAERVHDLGPRPLLCALIEAALGDVDHVLARYGALDADVVRALGADEFPPASLTLVRR
jgi:hypothetical protein